MLIEFTVSNYRSFRERQTFSMVAAPRLRKKENTFIPTVVGEKLPALLKVAAIYGPNASGKSNLLRAMRVVAQVARREPSSATLLPFEPFRFDKDLASEPSRFEINFIKGGRRYTFELAATAERILEERLTEFPKGKEELLYERKHVGETDVYEFGDSLEGGRDLHQTWRKLTGPRVLFLSQAVANSSEDLTQLRAPFTWITTGITVIMDNGMSAYSHATRELAQQTPSFADDISKFLQEVDVPVTGIRSDEIPTPPRNNADPDTIEAASSAKKSKLRTILTHRTALGEAEFDFSEESEGTKGLIGFWLPWSIMVGGGKTSFEVLAVDELDGSLHPEIVASLIEGHIKTGKGSQLIFSTHDTHLMDTKLLRRDQFWLTERDANGATQLRSVHDFEGRESEDLEKRYYEGRYRALPVLSKR